MIEKKLKNYLYSPDMTLRQAVTDLYGRHTTMCLVCGPGKKLLGILTLSDIKHAMLGGVDPHTKLKSIMNTQFVSAPAGASAKELEKLAKTRNKFQTGIVERVPLLNAKGAVVGLYLYPLKKKGEKDTVLVTGGAGYVGSVVCRTLLKKGYRLVVLDKLLFGKESLKDLMKHPRFTFIDGDIGDLGTILKAVQGVDAVVHLAGIVGDPAAALRPLQTMEENHFATKSLIDICKYYGVERFVFASSCSVYGAGEELLDEKSKLNPVSLYAQSKLSAEKELLAAAGNDFRPIILRFGTLYGLSPRMRFDLVANIMTAHAFYNKKITVDGGDQWRPLLHVEDAALACVAALEAPIKDVAGEIFSVGDTKENYRIRDIAEIVAGRVKGSSINHLDTVKDRRNYRVNFTKINKRMRWKASRCLPEGIEELVRAFKDKKFGDWKDERYNNYLTLKSIIDASSIV